MQESLIKNKYGKVLVVGFGRSGRAVIEFFVQNDVFVDIYDDRQFDSLTEIDKAFLNDKGVGIYFAEMPASMESYDVAVVSPGVSLDAKIMTTAKDANVNIIGELELAYQVGQGEYYAITGTNGKTTTTTLVGEIFKNANRDTRVVGNIGNPAIKEATTSTSETCFVAEVSSFQLETIEEFSPKVSAILNITPDHLDRHKTFENYADAKASIFINQNKEDYAVLNWDDEETRKLKDKCLAKVIFFSRVDDLEEGVCLVGNKITIKLDGKEIEVCDISQLQIPGSHNIENALSAVAVTYCAGIDVDVIRKTLIAFAGVEHRLEYVDTIEGIRFVNDSKGTNKDASVKAVEAMVFPTILIAGGYDKKSDYKELIEAFGDKVKAMVLFGATAEKIKAEAESLGFYENYLEKDMAHSVRKAYALAKAGYTVLLSPACASWDMYKSFEDRGKDFKKCVKQIKNQK
ncbi:MAG: UDP-N-acetylmuramoyl-L-alanine--D-glutamate ligase [Eubacteriales bacterium]|nr:UDP-N-acetylmuramoyl-L-alanine--D-glutamate ligase [Eubacteriales bacterium]MDY3332152.1 UDP-N-acetylmuramoyl-L-alanine--D-glutamate ligase [Gallibacter sp.]